MPSGRKPGGSKRACLAVDVLLRNRQRCASAGDGENGELRGWRGF
jgi:hypothetical protein